MVAIHCEWVCGVRHLNLDGFHRFVCNVPYRVAKHQGEGCWQSLQPYSVALSCAFSTVGDGPNRAAGRVSHGLGCLGEIERARAV